MAEFKSHAVSQVRAAIDKSEGLRERHKRDKRERIANAAIALFALKGYEATTLREIANEADVALGTLSLYARDKRDLVLMIFNKVVPPLMEAGRKKIDPEAALTDKFIAFFDPFYRAYARDVTLYRIILGQIYNGDQSLHGAENDAIRVKLIGQLADLIKQAVARGMCRPDADPQVSARCVFYIYFAAVRTWLFDAKADPDIGLETLGKLLDVHVRGVLRPAGRIARKYETGHIIMVRS